MFKICVQKLIKNKNLFIVDTKILYFYSKQIVNLTMCVIVSNKRVFFSIVLARTII